MLPDPKSAAPAGGIVAPQPQLVNLYLKHELAAYLDGLVITGENIGDIRRSCFVPWDSAWNGIVREETASRERRSHDPEAALADRPARPQLIEDNELEQARKDLAQGQRIFSALQAQRDEEQDRADKAEAALLALRGRLQPYCQHKIFCESVTFYPRGACTCGLDQALAEPQEQG